MQSAAATPTLASELDARLIALWRTVGRLGYGALSRTAASVLASLRDGGPQRVTALATAESVAQPSMTTLLSRLERDGLVERGPDPADARAVLATITAEGLERLTTIRAARAAVIEARLAELDPEDRDALAAAIPALAKLTGETV
jgi:DNA-binding MarR family transcriptional regulator